MSRAKHKQPHKAALSFLDRHRYVQYALIGLAGIVLLMMLSHVSGLVRGQLRQHRLAPFYSTTDLKAQGQAGEIVRQEPLGAKVDGGKGYRVLYRTQRGDGSYTFSSGMVFVPNNANAGTPRPVVAWAHGTLGLGEQCAPSRTANPVGSISGISDMLKKGWVVTATDYAGFGTPGVQGYLVGGDEAHDVLNSVRAARNLPGSLAGTNFIVWGHSQGGNSALFTANQSATYAPELHLAGTVASAPAAELVPLLDEQYGKAVTWVIGPLIVTSWPAANPQLNANDVMTATGRDNYKRIAGKCIQQSAVAGLFRTFLHQRFFSVNPLSVPAWHDMAAKQSAPIPPANRPLMVVESKSDKVVLPDTTALFIQKACRAGSNLSSLWLGNVNHQDIPKASANQVIGWINGRFTGQPSSSDCAQPLPVKPA